MREVGCWWDALSKRYEDIAAKSITFHLDRIANFERVEIAANLAIRISLNYEFKVSLLVSESGGGVGLGDRGCSRVLDHDT